MMSNNQKYNKLTNEIAKIIASAGIDEDIEHSPNTLKWVLHIDPKANEELKISALSHDIDRAVEPRILQEENEDYDSYKMRHAKRSADLIKDIMPKHGYSKTSIDRVYYLVTNHEIGGDDDANTLMDADSISYFDCGIEIYCKKRGIEKTKAKISFMYDRSTPRARQIIKTLQMNDPELEKACKDLFY